MFNHCGRKFKPSEIWFLANNSDCYNRVLYIGVCPRCLKDLVCLVETSKSKEKTFYNHKQGMKARKEIELCRLDKIYTSHDIQIEKGKPCGWIYGSNKEIKNKQGKVVKIKQFACDYFGQKELVKTIIEEL